MSISTSEEYSNFATDVYTDGSFSNGRAFWAFVVICDDQIQFQDKGEINDANILTGRQVGAEIQAVIEAIKYCKKLKLRARVFYDYSGIECWADGSWRANKFYSIRYKEFIQNHLQFIESFVKVRAHSGNKWNEYVDKYAKVTESNY